MSEYEAERIAVLAKTERLRALRLARDAARQGIANDPPPAAAPKPARKKKAKAEGLASWLNVQKSSGRRG